MSMLFLATGEAWLGIKKTDKDGNVVESTNGRFDVTDDGLDVHPEWYSHWMPMPKVPRKDGA